MWSERCLALVRQAVGSQTVPAEKVAAAGLLAQIFSQHMKLGRDDPRVVQRKHLVQDGVPIRARPESTSSTHQRGSFVNWMLKQDCKFESKNQLPIWVCDYVLCASGC